MSPSVSTSLGKEHKAHSVGHSYELRTVPEQRTRGPCGASVGRVSDATMQLARVPIVLASELHSEPEPALGTLGHAGCAGWLGVVGPSWLHFHHRTLVVIGELGPCTMQPGPSTIFPKAMSVPLAASGSNGCLG